MSRIALSELIRRSKSRIGNVHHVVEESALEMIKRAYDEGINVQLSDGLRTNAQQQALYDQGRTKPGKIVTNARPGTSYHNYGLAIDFFLVSQDGTQSIWVVNKDWRRVAQIGKSLGFEWGGDWKGFQDNPHLQMTGSLSIKNLQAGKRPNLKVNFGSSPVKPKPVKRRTLYVTKPVMNGADVLQVQQALARNFFYPDKGAKNNGVDGWYGEKTKDAVRRYQSMNGLKADGVVGENTYKKLGL